MKEQKFVDYLQNRYGEKCQQAADMFDDAVRVERVLKISFDEIYESEGCLDAVIEMLRYSAADVRNHKPLQYGFVVRGDPLSDKYYQSVYGVMRNLRCSVRRYNEFLDLEK